MKAKRSISLPTVGIGSLLTVFAVLCLTVFAVLSVTTVLSDCRLSEKSRQAVIGYYEADCQAQTVLAKLRTGQRPEGVKEENGVFAFSCAISDTQALVVRVRLEGEIYEILQYQAVSTLDWQADDTRNLWDGKE